MKRLLAVLLLACGAGDLAAVVTEPLPAIGPAPRVQPLVPLPDDPTSLTPAQRLERRLAELMRDRERAIAALLREHAGLRPAAAVSDDPRLVPAQRERDSARAELTAALEAHASRSTPGSRRDPLEVARPEAQARQVEPLSIANALDVAACYRLLAQQGEATSEDLGAASRVLADIDPAKLSDSDRARADHLAVWFLAERARRASGPEQQHLAAQARSAAAAFAKAHAGSDLAIGIDALLVGLP